MLLVSYFFFFFQAEDGIRDVAVTGVQTCALPILKAALARAGVAAELVIIKTRGDAEVDRPLHELEGKEIGIASCRERVSISAVAVSLKKKNMRLTDGCARR